ncbi:hypothetical protein FQA39_LY12529 [Lamprigera yunnana]|nr:hypothetical protein FQA39_LY12529 [Lamprigera yunnana]
MNNILRSLCGAGNRYCDTLKQNIITSAFKDNPDKNFEKKKLDAQMRLLRGKTLTIATSQNPPLNYADYENGKWVGKGFAFEFIKYIQEKVPFSYDVVVPRDQVLGNRTNGVFGILARKEADLAAAMLPVVHTQNQLFRYSVPLDMGEWVVFMKRPLESATGSGLLAPFTFDVWILILVYLICMAPVVSAFVWGHKKACPGEQNLNHSVFACGWFVYGALIKQGSTMVPIADSTRLIFATWWIFITVLTAFYTANLTAFLTLSEFTLPVAKPEDIGSKRYTWVTDVGNVIEDAASNVSEIQKDLKGSKAYYVFESKDAIVYDIVKEKDYLYIGEKPQVEHIMYKDYNERAKAGLLESERCVFVITTWPVLERERAFAYSQDFQFKELFDNLLQHLVEGGVIKEKLRDDLPKASICPLNLKSIERQLRNTDFLLTYYVISTGYAFSLLSFILEFLFGLICKAQLYNREETTEAVQSESPRLPPSYHTLFGGTYDEKNKNEYWVVRSDRGNNMVPTRSPSAIDTCFLPLCIKDEVENPIAFVCLNDYPNVPSIPSWEWSSWLHNIYQLDMVTPRNSLWIHLVVCDKRYVFTFTEPLLKSIFGEHPFLEYIILLIPPGICFVEFMEGFGTRIVPPGYYEPYRVQTLFLLIRQHFIAKYKVRRAVEEDNDDLAPLIHSYSKHLQDLYGKFYIAEMITTHPEAGRQVIVAEYQGTAVAILILNSTVNDVRLNDEFELAPFYGLRKPHPNDVQEIVVAHSLANLSQESDDNSLSKLHLREESSESSSIVTEEEQEEEGRVAEYPEDDISLIDVTSVHLLLRKPLESIRQLSTVSNAFSATTLSLSDYEMHLFSNRNALSRVDFGELEYNAAKSIVRNSYLFFVDVIFLAISETEDDVVVPTYLGNINAFTLELSVSQIEHETESIPLLLEAAFECYPDREYCVISLPSTCPPFPTLDHFVHIAPRSTSIYAHELYVVHKNAINSNFKVRASKISDVEAVQNLTKNVMLRHALMDHFLSAVCEGEDFLSYVLMTEDKVVGVAVVRGECEYEYINSHYDFSKWIVDDHHKKTSFGVLLHLVLSPIFLRQCRFFLKEILRLSDYSVMSYRVKPVDTNTLFRVRPLCGAISYMIPVRPRRIPEFTQTDLDNCRPEEFVTQEREPFALYIITSHYCTLKHYEINARIVVVGCSTTALAFLDSLTSPNKSCNANFTNVTIISPHGFGYPKTYSKTRDMMFINRTSYNYRQMLLISMRTHVNIIDGVVTKINRKTKTVMINETSLVPYDLLFLMCGRQFQKPLPSGGTKLKTQRELPENIFFINTELDATRALTQLKLITELIPKHKYMVIVYGFAIEAYCCIAALLEYGVPGKYITFVEPYPPQNRDHTLQQIIDPEVDSAVTVTIENERIAHYKSYYFVDWTTDKETAHTICVTFESRHRRIFLDCVAMFMYNDKIVSPKTFMAIINAGLVFDGALVIGPDCKTNDPYIYGAGTLTKYSRRYYADHLSHKCFNVEEIGFELGQQVRRKLIPNYDQQPDEDMLTCTKGNMIVPQYKKPLIIRCHLPGCLQYLSVTKPGIQVPLLIAMSSENYGEVLVTGDCKTIDKQGYFRLHLNQYGIVETITCLAKFNIDFQNLTSLWGKHEKLLNNLKFRFQMGLVADLFEYFKEPWTCAIYHDRFPDLQNIIHKLMLRQTVEEKNSPLEDLIKIFNESNWNEAPLEEKKKLEKKFFESGYHRVIEETVLEFLGENKSYLPMTRLQTNDPYIYGAGTLTKYSRRYYADHLSHKCFNVEEIGFELGQQVRRKLIPNYDQQPDEDMLTCTKGNMIVPQYKKPLIIRCHLPGCLQYLSVTKPGIQVPLLIAMSSENYGEVLVTGDCKTIDKQGYFRLHLNQYGIVETITCLAKFVSNISSVNTTFKEPWTCAIYHDRFPDLQNIIHKLMLRQTVSL